MIINRKVNSVFKRYHTSRSFTPSFTHKMAAKTSWHRYATNYVTVMLCIAVNITKRVTSVARGRICATHAMCRCTRTAARSMHTSHIHTHTHTHTRLTALFPGLPG